MSGTKLYDYMMNTLTVDNVDSPDPWRKAKTFADNLYLNDLFLQGKLDHTPIHGGKLEEPDDSSFRDLLRLMTRKGFLTTDSQDDLFEDVEAEAVDYDQGDLLTKDWFGVSGKLYSQTRQMAYVCAIVPVEIFNVWVSQLSKDFTDKTYIIYGTDEKKVIVNKPPNTDKFYPTFIDQYGDERLVVTQSRFAKQVDEIENTPWSMQGLTALTLTSLEPFEYVIGEYKAIYQWWENNNQRNLVQLYMIGFDHDELRKSLLDLPYDLNDLQPAKSGECLIL